MPAWEWVRKKPSSKTPSPRRWRYHAAAPSTIQLASPTCKSLLAREYPPGSKLRLGLAFQNNKWNRSAFRMDSQPKLERNILLGTTSVPKRNILYIISAVCRLLHILSHHCQVKNPESAKAPKPVQRKEDNAASACWKGRMWPENSETIKKHQRWEILIHVCKISGKTLGYR